MAKSVSKLPKKVIHSPPARHLVAMPSPRVAIPFATRARDAVATIISLSIASYVLWVLAVRMGKKSPSSDQSLPTSQKSAFLLRPVSMRNTGQCQGKCPYTAQLCSHYCNTQTVTNVTPINTPYRARSRGSPTWATALRGPPPFCSPEDFPETNPLQMFLRFWQVTYQRRWGSSCRTRCCRRRNCMVYYTKQVDQAC